MAERKSWKAEVRAAFAEYVYTEGCSCCRSDPEHDIAKSTLGRLLGVRKYADRSGYDFYRYRVTITLSARKKRKAKRGVE